MSMFSKDDAWKMAQYEALTKKIEDLSSTIQETFKQIQEKDAFCHETTHSKFTRMLTPIRYMLHYKTYSPPVHREPSDNVRTIEFFHPMWPKMPVCRIEEEFMCGLTYKNYFINEPFMKILGSMTNENPDSDPNRTIETAHSTHSVG